MTVIDEEQLIQRGVNDLEDLLRHEPGVDIARQTSATDPFNTIGGVTIRGVGGNRAPCRLMARAWPNGSPMGRATILIFPSPNRPRSYGVRPLCCGDRTPWGDCWRLRHWTPKMC
ncbi:TonB-dependent receptor plug domain-containing protein [Pseudophaeobacter leonis]|uniref:TonB-dependent receptor plug domain-containing protein n=1 Tax=Pseudophaeobacter leonis TaxID=1144477 RepID=UPI003B98515D